MSVERCQEKAGLEDLVLTKQEFEEEFPGIPWVNPTSEQQLEADALSQDLRRSTVALLEQHGERHGQRLAFLRNGTPLFSPDRYGTHYLSRDEVKEYVSALFTVPLEYQDETTKVTLGSLGTVQPRDSNTVIVIVQGMNAQREGRKNNMHTITKLVLRRDHGELWQFVLMPSFGFIEQGDILVRRAAIEDVILFKPFVDAAA